MKNDHALNSLIMDTIPDTFSITLAGLEDFTDVASLKILDASIAHLVESFSALYSSNLLLEIVALDVNNEISSSQESIENKLSSMFPNEILVAYPHVYVRPDVSTFNIYSRIASMDMKTYYMASSESLLSLSEKVSVYNSPATGSGATNGTGNGVTSADIQIYQICLWTAIGLVLIISTAIYALVDMSSKRGDAMLYSRFNPMWSDRKRR